MVKVQLPSFPMNEKWKQHLCRFQVLYLLKYNGFLISEGMDPDWCILSHQFVWIWIFIVLTHSVYRLIQLQNRKSHINCYFSIHIIRCISVDFTCQFEPFLNCKLVHFFYQWLAAFHFSLYLQVGIFLTSLFCKCTLLLFFVSFVPIFLEVPIGLTFRLLLADQLQLIFLDLSNLTII